DDALDTVPGARARFDSLPPERSASLVGWIEEAELPQTRRRRVAETVRRLVVSAAGETVVTAPPRSHGLVWLIIGALLATLVALFLWLAYGRRQAPPPARRVV